MKKTKLTRSLLAACSIVALSAVMYGCIGGGDDPATDETDMEQPTEPTEPMQTPAEQLAAAEAALTAAETAVAELTPTSTGEEARAAYEALADAQTAVNAATALPANQIAALQTQLDAANAYGTVAVAIIAAQGAINELGDEPAAADVATAAALVTAARTALTGATALDADATTSLTSQVASVETQIADIQTAVAARPTPEQVVAAAAKVAADTEAAGTKETAIGAEATQTTDGGLGGSAEDDSAVDTYEVTVEHDGTDVTVEVTDSAMPEDDDPKFAQTMDLGDGRTMHVRDNGEGVEEVVIVSTDIDAPKATPFADVYELNTNNNDADPPVAQSLMAETANVGMWSSADFPSTADTTREYPQNDADTEDMNEGTIEGSFDGADGTFECVSTDCSIQTDGDGKLMTVDGTWHFTPDEDVTVDVDDADYLRYGFWLKRTTDDMGATTYNEVETFAISSIAASGDVSSVGGSASYEGDAVGVYVHSVTNSDGTEASATSGHFTADASLTAHFSGTSVAADLHNSVTGTIDNFALAGGEENGWSVALKGGITDTGTVATGTDTPATNGTANGGGAEGSFSATFHGSVEPFDHDMDTDTDMIPRQPSSVVGEFNANFSNGTAAGGFGARKQN